MSTTTMGSRLVSPKNPEREKSTSRLSNTPSETVTKTLATSKEDWKLSALLRSSEKDDSREDAFCKMAVASLCMISLLKSRRQSSAARREASTSFRSVLRVWITICMRALYWRCFSSLRCWMFNISFRFS